ncbi:hypothetical protein FEM03_18975 [Phragmitibacter flavus]|uniref:Cytochrome c n=1 Tax=Phragmitibacter flavus TaxID=2576071 RepID=A0A5R8KA48_9BACT|nr:hypothetical protein [Phragmitibacter flavus]TLD69184.1 hypothetical protein FEM03_18975 [Phragmitibacter flavus]
MKTSILAIASLTLALITVHAAEIDNNKQSISDVMESAMKGSTSLHKKVSTGQGTDADAAELLAYFKSLPANQPPQGDDASWTEKTTRLINAAQGVVDKKPNAKSELQLAGNCKACHNVHKGE